MSAAVEAFRGISWLIAKWLFYITVGIVVLGAIITGVALVYSWWTVDRHTANVKFMISTESKDCPAEFPIHVLVGNASGRTIEKVEFRLAARRPQRSTDIAKYHSYDDDHIIAPKKGYGICWAVPELSEKVANPRTLEWSIDSKYIRFKD